MGQAKTKIELSVRDFALPIPRIGSIEVHSGYSRLTSGQEIHTEVQKSRKSEYSNYKPEHKVSHVFETDEFKFSISGRIDGLFADDTNPLIEEIKSAFNVNELRAKLDAQPDHPYFLQLKTYGYIYWLTNAVTPKLKLHLVSASGTGYTDDIPVVLDVESYERWLKLRLVELSEEATLRMQRKQRRKDSAKTLSFPFEKARTGQKELIASIERNLGKGAMLVQAPTGLGKTAAVLFPLLNDSLSRGQKVVYITPKNSQHSVAQDAVARLRATAPQTKCLTLTAKAKACFKPEPICNPEYCEYARDFYKKLYDNNLVNKVIDENDDITVEVFQEVGKQYQVCPFELSVETIEHADVVIGDYNYVFSPRSLIGRLTNATWTAGEKPNLIIDEAHNLPSRTTDYYSPSISTADLEYMRPSIRALPGSYAMEGEALLNRAISLVRSHAPADGLKESKVTINTMRMLEHDAKLREFLNRYIQSALEIESKDAVLRLCHTWSQFTDALTYTGDNFFSTCKTYRDEQYLKITCCDASEMLRDAYKEFENVVAFSATMKPFDYYAKLSGFDVEDISTLEFTSPFPKENRKLLIIPQVSTKYSDREKNYGKIAEAIKRILPVRRGNYFVFFPSFEFLERVHQIVEMDGFQIIAQKRETVNSEVNEVLSSLRKNETPTVVFAVQGGVFSEGVDYPGEMIIGAIIVGPALPRYDLERELLREYYEKNYSNGFDYAYTYPAMTRVVQAAGRVIRSEQDHGLIVLMDQRFVVDAYSRSMPSDWFEQSAKELVSQRILKDIEDFWTRH